VTDNREIARRSLDLQARAKDYALTQIPAYREWSRKKLEEGESEAFVAHLDAMSMWLLPEEVPSVGVLADGEKENNTVLHFEPNPPQPMIVACLWSHWSCQEGPDRDWQSVQRNYLRVMGGPVQLPSATLPKAADAVVSAVLIRRIR
jgi:hypothetical protein